MFLVLPLVKIGLLKYNTFLTTKVDLDVKELRFIFLNIQHEIDYSEELSEENIKTLMEKFITKRFM